MIVRGHRTSYLVMVLAIIVSFMLNGCVVPRDRQQTLTSAIPLPTRNSTRPAPTQASATPIPAKAATTLASRVTVVASPTALSTETAIPRSTTETFSNFSDNPTVAATPPPPAPSNSPWLLAYDSDVEGNDEVYLLAYDGGSVVNITRHPAEDRLPAWSPDGHQIAFQTNRDGNWEIYALDLRDETLKRLTFHQAYDGGPAWSPDGKWIYFASTRDSNPCPTGIRPSACPDLEVYRVPVTGGEPERLTNSPGGDYQPIPSPDGQWVAFTSWRDGDKEIYVMPFGGGAAANVTASPGDDWSAIWSRDGKALIFLSQRDGDAELYHQALSSGTLTRLTTNTVREERPTMWANGSLLFARYDPGPAFEAYNPYRPGTHHLYVLPTDERFPRVALPIVKARHPAAASLAEIPATSAAITGKPRAQPYPQSIQDGLELRRLDDIAAPDARLIDGVDEAFQSWRGAVHAFSGHDFLGRLSDVFRPAGYYSHRLGYMSWHKAGRAVDLLFDWPDAENKDALVMVREDLAGEVYWRLFLRCATQDGSMGEPLTEAPWYFWWHPDPAKEPETLANGGRRLPVPPGYYVDLTTLAERYGWARIPSYHLDDFHWQRDSTATEYWHYQHTDDLTWYEAMSQLYPQELLEEHFSRPAAAAHGQTEAVMDGKGLPPIEGR